jgi:hypothetical protein
MTNFVVPSPEPRWGAREDLRSATCRLLAFAGSPGGAMIARLLEHLDYAWVTYLRPLQLEAERALDDHDSGLTAHDASAFIDLHVTDPFRVAAGAAATLVPYPDGWTRDLPDLEDATIEMESALRCVRLLSLGAGHPDFPLGLRFPVLLAATALPAWHLRFVELSEALEGLIADIVHGRADFGAHFALARPRGPGADAASAGGA